MVCTVCEPVTLLMFSMPLHHGATQRLSCVTQDVTHAAEGGSPAPRHEAPSIKLSLLSI